MSVDPEDTPGSTITSIKTEVARSLEHADANVRVHTTDYFNNSFAPDLVLSWPREGAERFVYLRTSANIAFLIQDVGLIDDSTSIVMPLSDITSAPAAEEGRQGELKEALLHGYFGEAEVLSDPAVLRRIAGEIGLDADRVEQVLTSREFEADVEADVNRAARYGATGVPFYVVDEKYGVSGAQPAEVFTQVLERAWADEHPALETIGGGGADACGPDGCAI